MKILHTGDWHLGAYVGPQCDDPMKRMANTIKCLDVVVETAKKEEPDAILICGDIFHTAKVWADRSNVELRVAADYINRLKKIAPVAVLYGTPNHDSMEQFKSLIWMCGDVLITASDRTVWFYVEPGVYTIQTTSGPLQVAGIPGFDKGHFRAKFPGLSAEEENKIFSQELSNIVAGLSAQLDQNIPSVLMAHHTVTSCDLDNGQNSIFLQNEVILDTNALDNSEFDLVCLGHIHKAQQIDCRKPAFYSGSIDAFTFNDEGQEKGFLLHDINVEGPYHDFDFPSKYIDTPAREFLTCNWSANLKEYIDNGLEANMPMDDYFKDAVVRILYTCDSDTEKALDKKKLERDLYNAGAYYVSEIRPEKITASVNKERLTEKLTVKECLIKYLDEKLGTSHDIENDMFIETAFSIIEKIQASTPSGSQTGLFLPVEIEVHNYRSYADEKLEFKDIYFAMVNGVNGSGKSSLFMDAIVDCLYEEPREGELTGWIRNNEKSGSISFTFQLGAETYRVTRTRQKSGKATLAIAKKANQPDSQIFLSSEIWIDESSQKIVDTQQKIIELLGMDADTFRSCVLIMQDQYGKFMEAKPEERMNVLANLLGLGIYDELEAETKEQLREVNRSLKETKIISMDLEAEVEKEDFLLGELNNLSQTTQTNNIALAGLRETRDKELAEVEAAKKAKEQINTLYEEIKQKTNQLFELTFKFDDLQNKLQKTKEFLSQKTKIDLLYTELQLSKTKLATFDEKLKILNEKKEQRDRLEKDLTKQSDDRAAVEKEIALIQVDLKEYDKIANAVEGLEEAEDLLYLFDEESKKWSELVTSQKENELDIKYLQSLIDECQKKKQILENSGCIDFSKAKCNFLINAKEAVEQLHNHEISIIELKTENNDLAIKISELCYSKEEHEKQKEKVKALQNLKKVLSSLDSRKNSLDIYLLKLEVISENQQNLKDCINKICLEINQLIDECSEAESIKSKIAELHKYEEQWQQLPAAQQFEETTVKQIEEIEIKMDELRVEIKQLCKKVNELDLLANNYPSLQQQLSNTESYIRITENSLNAYNQKIGSLKEKLEVIAAKKEDMQKAFEEISALASKASVLEMLVQAFSQDGIPHQIMRDIVPELEAAANEILSQMTGGKMRIEFRTERNLKSNKAKEVATLDIIIMSVDKGELPYLSHSGGQRVRAALAVSFALAMVKASRVGLQLGMLFVDEPPFLDAEGVEAYCSALQFIHSKYPEMRIVAISHDENMKVAFPQQITIEVTDQGSKVRIS